MSSQQPSPAPAGAIPEEEVINGIGNSHPLDISDMPGAPAATANGTNTEEAIVQSLVAAAHATIAKVDKNHHTSKTTRKQKPPSPFNPPFQYRRYLPPYQNVD